MNKTTPIPFYAKIALIFVSLFAFIFVMYIGKNILIPIVYATIIAILLNPMVTYMTNRKINRILAISISVLIATSLVFGIFYLILSQLTSFSDTFPTLQIKINSISNDLVLWISKKFNIEPSAIYDWINTTENKEISHLAIGEKLNQASQIVVTIMLLPVYLIMILYYKPLFLEFIRKLFRAEHHGTVAEVLTNSKKIIQTYLTGLFFELIIVSVLNILGLLFLDIEYAILLGLIGGILNIIPYIGGIIGVALFMLIALATKSPIYMVYVMGLYSLIQFVDNNYIVPKIVASRVQINAFISVIVILIGEAIWGVSGMFLSIPLTAIIKVIFDHIEPLKPWGFLLGNTVPTATKFSFMKSKK